jgi:hypothetical protein
LTKTIGLPDADATTVTVGIDLGPQPYAAVENLDAVVSTTTATAVNAKVLTITVQHSDTLGSGYAAVPELGTLTITGAATAYAATTRIYKLPPTIKRFVRLSALGDDGGGDATDGTMILSILR